MLLDEYHCAAKSENRGDKHQAGEKTERDVAYEEGQKAASDCRCRPINVTSPKPQEFKRLLKPLEYRVVRVINPFFCHGLTVIIRRTKAGSVRRR